METARHDYTAEHILDRFRDVGGNPEEVISPYKEIWVHGDHYYFTPGGFLYRRDLAVEAIGGVLCGYLT